MNISWYSDIARALETVLTDIWKHVNNVAESLEWVLELDVLSQPCSTLQLHCVLPCFGNSSESFEQFLKLTLIAWTCRLHLSELFWIVLQLIQTSWNLLKQLRNLSDNSWHISELGPETSLQRFWNFMKPFLIARVIVLQTAHLARVMVHIVSSGKDSQVRRPLFAAVPYCLVMQWT
jgi:hypothetical protein